MASKQSSVLTTHIGEELEKEVDQLISEFVSFDSYYDFTSLSSSNTKYTEIGDPPDMLYERGSSDSEHSVPAVQMLSLSSPPTTVSFPEMKAKLTPGTSRAPDQSSIASSDWEILKLELQQLVKDHGRVAEHRFATRQKRAKLRQKRTTSTDLGINLMRELNVHFASGDHVSSPLLALFEQYKSSWDEYLVMEREYNDDEDGLDDREFQLEGTQEKIKTAVEQYGTDRGAITKLSHKDEQVDFGPNITYEGGVYHPLMVEYLSRRGTLELVNEKLWELRLEHKEAFNDYQMGRGLTAEPNEYVIDLLTNFRRYEDEILREKEALERETEQLKAQCDQLGLSEEPSPITPADDYAADSLSDQLQSLPAHKHLLWEKDTPQFFESALAQEPLDTGEFINKWIFHQLCQSSIEVLHLKESFISENMKIDSEEELLDLALRYWKVDAANKPVRRPMSEIYYDTFNANMMPTNVKANNIQLGAPQVPSPSPIRGSGAESTHESQKKAPKIDDTPTNKHFNTRPGLYSSKTECDTHFSNKPQLNFGRGQASSAIFHYDLPLPYRTEQGSGSG
ncbi:hypothetical protein GTR04_4599 [Trichophyton interdigitale]|uniref:Uncharacterized protein n=1 Tax=Trichophyton interdigitale TaxID=101480 RepID=A0A9P5CVR7_9EURO|nr:hypothetical protein GY631_4634 [Trichophyton interdigitale]KAF3892208.1 hypothetical protein GY632_4768 [Trichophyton interdigitale]KAG8208035.1 hypothetical protein GTR04_4599 [Trichophyton interdigitale]